MVGCCGLCSCYCQWFGDNLKWPQREDVRGSDVSELARGYRKTWEKSEWEVMLKPCSATGKEREALVKRYQQWDDRTEVVKRYPEVFAALAEQNVKKLKNGNDDRGKLLDGLDQEKPALYEFAVCHKAKDSRKFKVYIGQTGVHMHERQREYLTEEEDRMYSFFEKALEHDNQIMRRYACIPTEELVSVDGKSVEGDGRTKETKSSANDGKGGNKTPIPKRMRSRRGCEVSSAVQQLETRYLAAFDYAWNAQANPPKRYVWVEQKSTLCFWKTYTAHSEVAP